MPAKKPDLSRFSDYFFGELLSDSHRGVVLAVGSQIEYQARKAVARLVGAGDGVVPEDAKDEFGDRVSKMRFERLIDTLKRHRVVAASMAKMLDSVRELRNQAAHSPREFSLYGTDVPPGENASPNKLAKDLIDPLKHMIERVRIDPGWHSHRDGDLLASFVFAGRLIWEGLAKARRDLIPLVDPDKSVVFDILDVDPEVFCTVTMEQMHQIELEHQQLYLDEMEADDDH